MSVFAPITEPFLRLGRYRLLSPHAGIHVSPFALGGMSLGQKWAGMGAMSKESSMSLLDAFVEAGGNFIDTSNNYQSGESEEIIGEWMELHGNRDQLVVATKYSWAWNLHDQSVKHKINFAGNNTKSMRLSIEASLKKLRTLYVDIFYVHWWDYDTSVEEIMDSLHNLVVQGKVLYLGISDSPAWFVAKANQYARMSGKTQFSVYQGPWSILQREFEREIIPMCRSEGMAIAPWNVLAGGHIRSDEEERKREESGEGGRTIGGAEWRRTADEKKLCAALEQVGNDVGGASVSAVAIAYLLHKVPYVFPVVGGRKVEHLYDNIKALSISLSPKQMEYLESILPFEIGFPHNQFGTGLATNPRIAAFAPVDRVPVVQPFSPQFAPEAK